MAVQVARSFDAIPAYFKLHVCTVINYIILNPKPADILKIFFYDTTVSEEKMNLFLRDKNITKHAFTIAIITTCVKYLLNIFSKN